MVPDDGTIAPPRFPFRRTLTDRARPSKFWLARWLVGGSADGRRPGEAIHEEHHPWHRVIWLTGVDYFSTLGYQPGIALIAAGILAPFATGVLVLVTLLGALPIYAQVARRSYAGQGSIAMLENLLPGWNGKLLVLALLGFAATDFVITMTLSAADAAKHAVENPLLHPLIGDHKLGISLLLLTLLAVVFLAGFREAIGAAMLVAVPYLALTLVVLMRGMIETFQRPEVWTKWHLALDSRGSHGSIAVGALVVFPVLALGLSGFETGVSVMPLVDGGPGDRRSARGGPAPLGRIANTRKLLVAAAAIMSVMLILSSVVTTLLIPRDAYRLEGPASGRALAYLAHEFFPAWLASVYDVSTILILSFAGASAMAGLLNLVPRYLPRFGMAPEWARASRPLVLVFMAVAFTVTILFRASVDVQGGVYATGVLVLITSAACAVAMAAWRGPLRWLFLLIALVFIYTTILNIY